MKYVWIAALALAPLAAAGQGMWFPHELGSRKADMKAKGMVMKVEDVYSASGGGLNESVVHFGGFCTGEVISSKGLVLTNHHCGFDAIQSHSSIEDNLLEHGFWAASFAEEKPNPGLYVDFVHRTEDVTLAVQAQVAQGKTVEEAMNAVSSAQPKPDASWVFTVKPIYAGNRFVLTTARRYPDVRLVGAPPSAVGKYGSDTDNWVWPRHTGDFSLFRVYTAPDGSPAAYSSSNVPMNVVKPLEISLKGVEEGDFTMIYGFPGRTDSYMPVSEVKQQLDVMLPARVALRTEVLRTWDSAMRVNPLVKIQYAAKYASVANAWKKWMGQIEGMAEVHGLDTLAAREAKIAAFSAEAAELAATFRAKNEDLERQRWGILYYQELIPKWDLVAWSRLVLDYLKAIEEGKDLGKYQAAIRDHYKDWNPELDRRAVARLLALWNANANVAHSELNLNYFVSSQIVESVPELPAEGGDWSSFDQRVKTNPALNLSKELRTEFLALNAALAKQEQAYQAGMKQWLGLRLAHAEKAGVPIAADANSTLRVAYGWAGGFSPADGMRYTTHTTADGVLAKYRPGDYEFDLPEAYRAKLDAKEYGAYAMRNGELPVCFLAANHTSGGNSGSPAFNAKGQLIGLNFDRVWEGTMSDFYFTPQRCRNIMVDIRYVLWVVDEYAGAKRLIDEMNIVR
ncbi:MAG: hypothetical protein RLZZ261_1537 [Bacteroidota bacterium]